MRALTSFTVRVRLPEPLAPLRELATNLRWSWHEPTRQLFRSIDPPRWDAAPDPVRLLDEVPFDRLGALADDPGFLAQLRGLHDDLRAELDGPRWFQGRDGSPLRAVTYFSPEFGIAEVVPQYSGGLGVLAGDHLKAASGLGIPLVGVGLMYRQGYFRQALDADGWQQERFPNLDPHAMALTPVSGATVQVDLAGTPCTARVWQADVGRIRLYLLDSDVDDNDDEARLVTDRLYGGGTEHRIRQEILLGIGGVRALGAVGAPEQVFHTNEGHAGFLGLERIRRLIVDDGLGFGEAVEAARAGTIFTTHTPVPAGIDRFPVELMWRYFGSWAEQCGIHFDQLMALGRLPGESSDAPFNMAVMGLRLAGRSNGVSSLHGEVSRAMFSPVWPEVPVEEVPIMSVTNGVHAATWVSPEMDELFTRSVGPTWSEGQAQDWERVGQLSDDELWSARRQGRARLVELARQRLRTSLGGPSGPSPGWIDEVLDPEVLTLGFARRFASYKRATLLLSQPERLRALLLSAERPVQIVFAGKAHPADESGKQMIREIVRFARQADLRHRFVFIEDYDIAVARTMYQGCDVWLNNPRRPLEACGTSGEKAALNGSLNCSILDGWWAEMYDGTNGWAVASAEAELDLARRDELEAESLFEVLEDQVVPLFNERLQGVPLRWTAKVRASLASLGPRVLASRMVRDYTVGMYEPAAARADVMGGEGHERARALATWKAKVEAAWPAVRVCSMHSDAGTGEQVAALGDTRSVQVVVALGGIDTGDVSVQVVHGPVGASDELSGTAVVDLQPSGDPGRIDGVDGTDGVQPGEHRFEGTFTCQRSGRYGFTVRVLPSHPDLADPLEMGRVAWA